MGRLVQISPANCCIYTPVYRQVTIQSILLALWAALIFYDCFSACNFIAITLVFSIDTEGFIIRTSWASHESRTELMYILPWQEDAGFYNIFTKPIICNIKAVYNSQTKIVKAYTLHNIHLHQYTYHLNICNCLYITVIVWWCRCADF